MQSAPRKKRNPQNINNCRSGAKEMVTIRSIHVTTGSCGTEKSGRAERRICLETPALQIRSSVSGRRKDRSTPIKEERISMFLSKVHEILYTPATDRRNV